MYISLFNLFILLFTLKYVYLYGREGVLGHNLWPIFNLPETK